MPDLVYCAPADLYLFGLPRGAIQNPGRLAASVDASANSIALDVHGFDADDPVQFRAEAGGTLPTPLVAGVEYYADPLTDSTFRVAATPGGAAIDLTSVGSRVVVIAPLPILASIAWASRMIDDMLPAHVVPLEEPLHELVRMTCAELAAGKLLARTGSASKSLGEMVDAARKRLERWAKGVPLRGNDTPPPANLAASGATTVASRPDPLGWNRFGGL
jgi:hypothetical protein